MDFSRAFAFPSTVHFSRPWDPAAYNTLNISALLLHAGFWIGRIFSIDLVIWYISFIVRSKASIYSCKQ